MRATTLKFFGVVALSVITLIVLIAIIPTFSDNTITTNSSITTPQNSTTTINYSGIKSAQDGANFLSQFGWKVGENSVEEKIKIPSDFDAVLTQYNDMQKKQGLDLSKYKNKSMVRYTYEILNYPDVTGQPYYDKVYANIIVYRNKVVSGDICTADINGFVTGFKG